MILKFAFLGKFLAYDRIVREIQEGWVNITSKFGRVNINQTLLVHTQHIYWIKGGVWQLFSKLRVFSKFIFDLSLEL